jgi:hypothetical protein
MRLPSQPAAPASSSASTGDAGAGTLAAASAAAASLSALSLEENSATQPADAQAPADLADPAAAGAEGSTSVLPKTFDVAAGSFQCVWFFHLGERHHKPVFEWLQQQLQGQQGQQQQGQADGQGAAAAADDVAADPSHGFTVVATAKEVPQVSCALTESAQG